MCAEPAAGCARSLNSGETSVEGQSRLSVLLSKGGTQSWQES